MIAWSIDSMGIRGCFIDVSVDDEGANIDRFIVIYIVDKLCSNTDNYIQEIYTNHIVMQSIV